MMAKLELDNSPKVDEEEKQPDPVQTTIKF
jgi:hypothetical protein